MRLRTKARAGEPAPAVVHDKTVRVRSPEQPHVDAGRAGRFRFINVPQPGMVVARDFQVGNVTGAYVKVAPTIRSSERTSGFDQKAVRAQLLAAGALAVVVAPNLVPDAVEARTEAERPVDEARSPESHLRQWFEGVKGAEPEIVEEAFEQAMATVGDAGL